MKYYLLIFLFAFPLVTVNSQSGFLGTLEGVRQGSFYSFIEDGEEGGVIVFVRSIDGGLVELNVDSCGFISWGKKFGDLPIELHDYERIGDTVYFLGNFFGQTTSFFIIEFNLLNSSVANGIVLDVGVPVIPNSIVVNSNGEKVISFDSNSLFNHVPGVVRLSPSNEVLFAKLFDFKYNTSQDVYYFVTANYANDWKANATVLVSHRHLTLLDSLGEIVKVFRLRAENAPIERSRFLNVKPILSDEGLFVVCENYQASHRLVRIDGEIPSIILQSESFYFKESLGHTFIIATRSDRKNYLQKMSNGEFVLLGEIDPVFEDENPVIYSWDENLNLLQTVIIDAHSPLVSGAKAVGNNEGVFIMLNGGLQMLKTNPGFELECKEQLALPNPLGLNPRKLLLVADTFPLTQNLAPVVSSVEVPIESWNSAYQTLLCQTWYGPPLPELVIDTFICLGAEIDLKYTHPTGTVIWEDGSTDSLFRVSEPGQYRATVHHCGTSQAVIFNVPDGKCPCVFEVPNAFTPNGDGLNDTFGPVYQCYFADYHLRVFNRWGQEVFSSTEPTTGWDGRTGGQEAPADVYIWHVNYTAWHEGQRFSRSAKGEVSLLR